MKNLGINSFLRLLFLVPFVAAVAFTSTSQAAEEIRAGTWQLVKRQLPDGAVLTSPNVGGMFTVHPSGVYHVNIFWKTPDGKWASNSNITQFKYSDTDLSQTRLFGALDMGNSNAVVYTTPGESKRVSIKREGGRISYQHPFDPPFIVIDGDTLTATLEGVFIDTWERMK